jgi:ubiquitin thioesterase protein OTUB2
MGNSCGCIDRYKPEAQPASSKLDSIASARIEESKETKEFEVVEIYEGSIKCESITPREGKFLTFEKNLLESQMLNRLKKGAVLNITYYNSNIYSGNIYTILLTEPTKNAQYIATNTSLQSDQLNSIQTEISELSRGNGTEVRSQLYTSGSSTRSKQLDKSYQDEDAVEYELLIYNKMQRIELLETEIEEEQTVEMPQRRIDGVEIEGKELESENTERRKYLMDKIEDRLEDNHESIDEYVYECEEIVYPPVHLKSSVLEQNYSQDEEITHEIEFNFAPVSPHEEHESEFQLSISSPYLQINSELSTLESNPSTPIRLAIDQSSQLSVDSDLLQERFSTSSIVDIAPRFSFPLPRSSRNSISDLPFLTRSSYNPKRTDSDSYSSLIAYREDISSPISTIGIKKLSLNALKLIYYFNLEIKIKIDSLKESYSSWRRVKSDGNSFYRAIGVSYYEHLLRPSTSIQEFLKYLHLLTRSNHLYIYNIDKQFFNYHYDQLSILYRLKDSKDKKAYSFLQDLLQDENFDIGMVSEMRRITAKFIIDHSSKVEAPFDEYLQNILNWGKESENTEHKFISEALQVEINHVYLREIDRIDNAVRQRAFPVVFHILHKQGEYDILYTFEQGWEDSQVF